MDKEIELSKLLAEYEGEVTPEWANICTIEECSEVIKECSIVIKDCADMVKVLSKCQRKSIKFNTETLAEEVAHLQLMLQVITDKFGLSPDTLQQIKIDTLTEISNTKRIN